MNAIRAISGMLFFISLWFGTTAGALTPAQVAADTALAREAYERVHPGYTRYTDLEQLEAAWQAIDDEALQAGQMSVETFYLRVQATLALIRCDHTKAELPPAMSKARRTEPVYLPLRYALVQGRAIVEVADPATGIARFDEILKIDGQTIESLIDRFAPLIPVDGYTDYVRNGELASSREFAGGGIEHFMALEGVEPTTTLTVSDPSGVMRDVTVARIGLDEQRALPQLVPDAANFVDGVRLDVRDNGVAILTVDSFVNYRDPVDPDDIYAPLFRKIHDAQVTRLIVDLRHNGGGSDDARDRLLAHLIDKPTTIAKETQVKTLDLSGLREHLSTWEPRALKPRRWWFKKLADDRYRVRGWLLGISGKIKPARRAYTGEVLVLSSLANSSGSAMLIATLQDAGRATIVGGRPGGNAAGPTAGVLFFLSLPESGIRLRVPAQRIVTGLDIADTGIGIAPDVLVETSVSDVRGGRDVVLERALALPR